MDKWKDLMVKMEPLSWREIFYFSIIPGNGHVSIWLGPVLVTIDHFGWKHGISRLISVAWRPD